MNQRIFKSFYFLNFQNDAIEEKYQKFTNKLIIKYNFWFSLYGLIVSLFETIFHSTFKEKLSNHQEFKYYYMASELSYIVSGVFTIQCILHFYLKKEVIRKILVFFNYILVIFPFFNLRQNLFKQKFIEDDLYPMISILETVDCIFLILTFCVQASNSYLINLIYLGSICINNQFLGSKVSISSFVVILFVLMAISYLYKRQVKIMFFKNSSLKEENNWHSNLLEHLNCGFIVFNEKKIKFLNKYFEDIIYRINNCKDTKIEGEMSHGKNFKEKRNISNLNQEIEGKNEIYFKDYKKLTKRSHNKTSKFSNDDDVKKNLNEIDESSYEMNLEKKYLEDLKSREIFNKLGSEQILTYLLCDIKKEYSCLNFNSKFSKKSENFNLKEFLREMHSLYKERNLQDRFIPIGYKELILEPSKIEGCSNDNFSRKKENFTFEVYFRCHLRENKSNNLLKNYSYFSNSNSQEEEELFFELIFKDITEVKIKEHMIVNKKYNTEFGDWGLGIGDWGLGIGPNPQSPIPNPQSPIP
jgi:hypothetical protein